jgi:hypothetical protein
MKPIGTVMIPFYQLEMDKSFDIRFSKSGALTGSIGGKFASIDYS